MGTRRVNVRIPEELITKADVAAKIAHRNRAEMVSEALREYLEDLENDEAFKENLIERYFDDEIEFDGLTGFLGREDAEAVRASRSILNHGEELADELADH